MTTRTIHAPNATLGERFYPRVRYDTSDDGCWEWAGYVDQRTGYGRISNGPGPPLTTSVAAWILAHGAVPLGQVVRHRCDNRLCVRLSHLELGTQGQNLRDMVVRGRCNNKRVGDTCPAGHRYDRTDVSGFRQCSICRGIQARKSQWHRRRRLGKEEKVACCTDCFYSVPRCRCAEFGVHSTARGR